MSILFIGKRFYTNRDAWRERYGRIYQLPWHWARFETPTRLWLIDYHTHENVAKDDGVLPVVSTPAISLSCARRAVREMLPPAIAGTPRVVVASGDCYIGLFAYIVARCTGARFVFDVYDKYDEFAGYRRLPGFDPFGFLLRKADLRFFASRALMESLAAGDAPDVIVPNGIDDQRFVPLDKMHSRHELGLPADVTYVGYFGGMDVARGIDDLIAAVAILRRDGRQIQVLLGGKSRPDLDLGQPEVRYLGDLPFDRMPTALASCDVLALPYRHSALLDMASSCKIAEYIASERPIVATRTPNFLSNFPRQSAELDDRLATPGDVAGIAASIEKQLASPRLVHMPAGMSWREIASETATRMSLAHVGEQ